MCFRDSGSQDTLMTPQAPCSVLLCQGNPLLEPAWFEGRGLLNSVWLWARALSRGRKNGLRAEVGSERVVTV